MTEAEAVGLMVDGGFQERSEAVAKYERARLSSTQLAEYFVGSVAMWDLEDERRRRLRRRVGRSARRRGGARRHASSAATGHARLHLPRAPPGRAGPRDAADPRPRRILLG